MEGDEPTALPDLPEPPWVFRGRDMGRILALSDGVFAFAMTLLVLGLVLPAGTTGGGVPAYFQTPPFQAAMFAYILTFFVIGLWWQAHHLIFGYIHQYDRILVRANSVFLVTIAILPFATIVLNAANLNPVGVGFFAVNQIAAGLSLAGLWWYAAGPGRLVHPGVPLEWKRYLSRITLVTPLIFAISIPVAFWQVRAGELVWLGAFVVPIAFRHRARTVPKAPTDPPLSAP
jgi:TMEM175 potassium channel family protein